MLIVLSSLLLMGCDTVSYYSQGIQGHLNLVSQVQPIKQVINNDQISEKIRKQLLKATKAREFAINTLKLPNNNSYRGYVDLKRKNVTWNVIATKELSMKPYQSCFPVTGCLSYRGYFSEQKAKQFSQKLQKEGYETYMGGSSAYSTLGWFKDPIISTMLRHGDIRLIETLFHELAHQRLYIKNDSDFNEAFATAVGQNGTRQWLVESQADLLPKYNQYLRLHDQFLKLLSNTASQLKSLYKSPLSDQIKKDKKKQLIIQLKIDYQTFKKENAGYHYFDWWFKKPINNPRLAMVSVYHELVPDFERWLKACDNNFPRFYNAIENISKMGKKQRIKRLKETTGCH